jgi:hypothetical protein
MAGEQGGETFERIPSFRNQISFECLMFMLKIVPGGTVDGLGSESLMAGEHNPRKER